MRASRASLLFLCTFFTMTAHGGFSKRVVAVKKGAVQPIRQRKPQKSTDREAGQRRLSAKKAPESSHKSATSSLGSPWFTKKSTWMSFVLGAIGVAAKSLGQEAGNSISFKADNPVTSKSTLSQSLNEKPYTIHEETQDFNEYKDTFDEGGDLLSNGKNDSDAQNMNGPLSYIYKRSDAFAPFDITREYFGQDSKVSIDLGDSQTLNSSTAHGWYGFGHRILNAFTMKGNFSSYMMITMTIGAVIFGTLWCGIIRKLKNWGPFGQKIRFNNGMDYAEIRRYWGGIEKMMNENMDDVLAALSAFQGLEGLQRDVVQPLRDRGMFTDENERSFQRLKDICGDDNPVGDPVRGEMRQLPPNPVRDRVIPVRNELQDIVGNDFEGIGLIFPAKREHKRTIPQGDDKTLKDDLRALCKLLSEKDSLCDDDHRAVFRAHLESLVYRKSQDELVRLLKDVMEEDDENVSAHDLTVRQDILELFKNPHEAYSFVQERSLGFLVRYGVNAKLGTDISEEDVEWVIDNHIEGDIFVIFEAEEKKGTLSSGEKRELKKIELKYRNSYFLKNFVEEYFKHYPDEEHTFKKVREFFEKIDLDPKEKMAGETFVPYNDTQNELTSLNEALSVPSMLLNREIPQKDLDRVKHLVGKYLDDSDAFFDRFDRLRGILGSDKNLRAFVFLDILRDILEDVKKIKRNPEKKGQLPWNLRGCFYQFSMGKIAYDDDHIVPMIRSMPDIVVDLKKHVCNTQRNQPLSIMKELSCVKLGALNHILNTETYEGYLSDTVKYTKEQNKTFHDAARYMKNVSLQIVHLLGEERKKKMMTYYKNKIIDNLKKASQNPPDDRNDSYRALFDETDLSYDELYRYCGFSKKKLQEVLEGYEY